MQIVRFFKRLLALPQTRSAWMRALALGLMMAAVLPARSDSVGQVQTTKFFTPETVTLLKSRLTNNAPGFVVGDLVSYIIQFTPVPNHSYVGAGGYITDYIPSGAEVVGAWFVEPNGSGDYRVIPPPSPALMAAGWGARGQASYTGVPGGTNWTTTDAYTVSACTTGGLTACNGRLSEVYADTGIFYSTDPRTQINTYPDTDGRARQGVNGYYINPTGLEDTDYNDNLNTLLGQTDATVHNYWDAANVNAFGTETMPTKTPRATNLPVQQTTGGGFNGPGTGSSPFNAGSAVAGPDTGYKLDYSGNVGPWQRISYPGSMVGTNAAGRATATGTNTVAGTPTSAGRILSTSNPLPSNTNAVRWAAGNLTVGVVSHVKITLRLTAPVPATGLINNSEVFGGDSSPVGTNFNDSGGTNITPGNRESAWRYTVPSVADNNSNLLITKDIVCVFSGTNCNPISGTVVPVNPKIRYRILYLNTGNSFQTNVVLKEQLPAKVAAAGNLYVLSGTDLRPSSPVLSVNSAAVGATRGANQTLTAIVGGGTVTFPPLVSLPPAMGGSFEIDVQYTAAAGSILSNVATIATSQVPDGARGTSSVIVDSAASLLISKSTSTPTVAPGGTATYTITITNAGSAAASAIVVKDFLPFYATASVDTTRRFSYIASSSSVAGGLTAVNPTTGPPNVPPYTTNTSQQQLTWTFAGSLPAGATATITFSARVGSALSSATYYNDAIVTYNNGSSQPQILNNRLNDAAPVVVTSPLTITKTVDCIYSGSVCNAYTGSEQVPANGKLRYKISYANTSAIPQTNVYVCDSLPTQIASYAAAVSTPGVAPTPSGPYSDSPSIGTRTNPANTACGLSGTTFSYTVIPSLAAGGSGTVYVDVLTNAASGSTLVNTAKIVSTESAGGATSTVYNSVRNEARLSISKTASTSSISPNGTVDYTMSITNTGNAAATTMTVYDFLPYYLTPVDATKRFQYVTTTTSVTGGLSTVFAGTATAPTIAPYSSTGNQEQVSWYFGAQSLAAGATANITFRAKAGANIPVGTTVYTNDAQVVYSTGSSTATAYVSAAAPVTVATNLSIVKTIDCVYNTAGTSACNAYDGSGIVPVNGKLRYKVVYANTGTSNQGGVYLCDTLPTQITSTAAVTTSTVADSPAIGSRNFPANACGLGATAGTFSYAIGTLTAVTSGTVYYDVQTNAASGATVTNTSKIVSTYATSGEVSAVSAIAYAVPNIQISKTTSTPTRSPGQTATYTVTLTNTGSTVTNSLKVYDFLPYSGSTNDASLRFSQGGTTTVTVSTGTVPTYTMAPAVVSPTVLPYNSNSNQQQVAWDFGNYPMQPGASLTLSFNATVAAIPSGSYNNSALVVYAGTGGGGSSSTSGATIIVSSPPTIAKAFDAPKAVSVSGLTTLTFTLTNPNSFALTGGSFTDDFPGGTLLGATSLTGSTCASASLTSRLTASGGFSTATSDHASIQVSGFTVPASGSCTVLVKVKGSGTPGVKVNTSSVLSSTNVVNSTGTASDTLNVYATPTVTKAFGTSTISTSGTTTLSITLGNPAGNPGSLTGITVADVFPVSPGAMTVGSASTTNGCGASLQGKTGALPYGAVAVNNTAVQVSGLTLAAGTTCTVVVTITANASGTYANTTTVVTATGPVALTGLVSNTATLVVSALNPSLVYMKTVATISDPINGTLNPKYIPMAEVRYSIRVTNQGPGTVDNDSMILTDQIPLNTELFVGDFVTSGPIAFVNSTTPVSGLSWTFNNLGDGADDISFSSTAAPGPYVFNYTPVPSGQGYDSSVTAIRLNPKGTMAGASGGNNPYAEFQFKVRIK